MGDEFCFSQQVAVNFSGAAETLTILQIPDGYIFKLKFWSLTDLDNNACLAELRALNNNVTWHLSGLTTVATGISIGALCDVVLPSHAVLQIYLSSATAGDDILVLYTGDLIKDD